MDDRKTAPQYVRAKALKAKPATPAAPKHHPHALRGWNWSDPVGIHEKLDRVLREAKARVDGTPYKGYGDAVRRIVYRAGRAALAAEGIGSVVGQLREKRSTRGRYSTDAFSVLMRMASSLLGSAAPDNGRGLSEPSIKKHAALMRVAHEWDIHWRFYDLVVGAVGAANMVGNGAAIRKRPSWADGLTSKAQAATEQARAEAKKLVAISGDRQTV